tara:strand:+ start:261 stop:833 length:573 start_codon:yes stop_codon:yes gene_type:complete
MALFGGSRDISLFQTLNKELINDIIQTEIGYYKFALESTISNMYGESDSKTFYEPVKLACLITRKDQEWQVDEFGPDMDQGINFALLKEGLEEINLVPEIGDILLFNNNFYEVDAKVENQLLLGKDPDYSIANSTSGFGKSHSIILSTHLSRVEKLNLIPLRGGVYPSAESVIEGDAKTAPSGSITSGSL